MTKHNPTRGTEHLRSYYADFSGCLSSDAYISYETLSAENAGRIILCGCLMHAHRRFAEAFELIRLESLTKAQIEELPEERALVLLGNIYNAEGRLNTYGQEERLQRRTMECRASP